VSGVVGTAFLTTAQTAAVDATASPVEWYLRLFENNHTPASTDVVSAYTQPTDVDYAAIPLPGSGWSVAVAAGVVKATNAGGTFTFAAGATVYGYYLSDSGNTIFGGAELFSSGTITVPSGGGTLTVTVEIDATSP
jgi:hypothetical protein